MDIKRQQLQEKIRFYSYSGAYIETSYFSRILKLFPSIKHAFSTLSESHEESDTNESEISLQQKYEKYKSALSIIQSFFLYRIWQWINTAQVRKIKLKKTIIPIQQKRWPTLQPLVSVIIPCYNQGEYVAEALDSLNKQTFQKWEAIVVNDGSTDPATIETLNKIKIPKVRVIHQNNRGLSAARNAGIRLAQGQSISCLDADDIVLPRYLEECVKEMEFHNYDVCYSLGREFGTSNRSMSIADFNINNLMFSNCVIVPALFKKMMWEKIGGYDEGMKEGYEDWEFWLRMAKEGWVGNLIKKELFMYRRHGKSMLDDTIKHQAHIMQYIKDKNKELYTNKEFQFFIIQKQNIIYTVSDPDINLH